MGFSSTRNRCRFRRIVFRCLIIGAACFSLTGLQSAPAASEKWPGKRTYDLAFDKLIEISNQLDAAGQSKATRLFGDWSHASIGIRESAELKLRIAILQHLRAGQTTQAIQLLEKSLDDKILRLAHCVLAAQSAGFSDLDLPLNQKLLDDRVKYPRKYSDPQTTERISKALDTLKSPSLPSISRQAISVQTDEHEFDPMANFVAHLKMAQRPETLKLFVNLVNLHDATSTHSALLIQSRMLYYVRQGWVKDAVSVLEIGLDGLAISVANSYRELPPREKKHVDLKPIKMHRDYCAQHRIERVLESVDVKKWIAEAYQLFDATLSPGKR